MHLIVGATRFVGKRIALRLAEAGQSVCALVRGGRVRAEAGPLVEARIKVVDGEMTKPETLPAACACAETVVCTATSMPHGRDGGLRQADTIPERSENAVRFNVALHSVGDYAATFGAPR